MSLFTSNLVLSKLYSANEIQQIQQSTDTKDFVTGFFTANDPVNYIVAKSKSKTEPLLVEYQLFQLLNEVSYKNKQAYLQTFINQMKDYPTQAMKMHEEGAMEVPVFNLSARARGIENIWLASASYHYYQKAFAENTRDALETLKNDLTDLKQPQWLGLKNSIKTLMPESKKLIDDYLLGHPDNIQSLSKFTAHYAILSQNKNLVSESLKVLNQGDREFVLRKMADYFDDKFVVKQLITTVKNNKNQLFALSLMGQYVDKNTTATDFLIQSLTNKKLSESAAFALMKTQKIKTLMQLKQLYSKQASDSVKQQIVFILKMNKRPEAQDILNKLSKTQASQIWLDSFKGELK